MPIYKNDNSKIKVIKEKPFKLEKELQDVTEKNLQEIFGLEFVSSEFQHNNLRIDTLAYDPSENTFVVIEYKLEKSFSVIDQGFAYLSLVLNNQAEFVLEFNKKFQDKKGKTDFDWTQMKVLFLARNFTPHQLEAINFKDLPMELWEITQYEGDMIQYLQIKRSGAKASIQSLGISNSGTINASKEVKNYTEEDYVSSKPEGKGKEFYQKMKEKISIIDSNIVVHPTKNYISFQLPDNWRNIFYLKIFGNKVSVDFTRTEPKDFNDPENKVVYNVNSLKNYNQHISSIEITNEKELEYGVYLIQQAYDRFTKEN